MPKFGIILYLVPNLAPCIAFAKFNAKFGIALENAFYVKMSNFDIGTQIYYCIGDALTVKIKFNRMSYKIRLKLNKSYKKIVQVSKY